ncbi:PD-(D/E)XK nuclease family transposase [bacterium]|nr:PD-(D/E)XK nuclease family transposase [bacterium]
MVQKRHKQFNRTKYLNSQRPIDDIMFRVCAQEKAWCQEVLRVILEDDLLQVESCQIQYYLSNFKKRTLTLDAFCTLGSGEKVNIEVQRDSKGDHQRRVRLHEALMTARLTQSGCDFKDIPDVCTVYICEFDIFKEGKALYHADRILRENGKRLDNGHTEIYVNALARDSSRAAALMKLFVDQNAYDYDKFPEVSGLKHYCLNTPKGRKNMDAVLEDYIENIEAAAIAKGEKLGIAKGEKRGFAKGEKHGRLLYTVSLFKEGVFDIADASRRAEMSEEEFKAFVESLEK